MYVKKNKYNRTEIQYDEEAGASSKQGTTDGSGLREVTYRPSIHSKSTTCLGGCTERRGSAVSRLLIYNSNTHTLFLSVSITLCLCLAVFDIELRQLKQKKNNVLIRQTNYVSICKRIEWHFRKLINSAELVRILNEFLTKLRISFNPSLDIALLLSHMHMKPFQLDLCHLFSSRFDQENGRNLFEFLLSSKNVVHWTN